MAMKKKSGEALVKWIHSIMKSEKKDVLITLITSYIKEFPDQKYIVKWILLRCKHPLAKILAVIIFGVGAAGVAIVEGVTTIKKRKKKRSIFSS